MDVLLVFFDSITFHCILHAVSHAQLCFSGVILVVAGRGAGRKAGFGRSDSQRVAGCCHATVDCALCSAQYVLFEWLLARLRDARTKAGRKGGPTAGQVNHCGPCCSFCLFRPQMYLPPKKFS